MKRIILLYLYDLSKLLNEACDREARFYNMPGAPSSAVRLASERGERYRQMLYITHRVIKAVED